MLLNCQLHVYCTVIFNITAYKNDTAEKDDRPLVSHFSPEVSYKKYKYCSAAADQPTSIQHCRITQPYSSRGTTHIKTGQ